MIDFDDLQQPATDAWYADRKGSADRPYVRVNYPTSIPNVYVDTISQGCQLPDLLPATENLRATLTIAGMMIDDTLDGIEMLILSCLEQIEYAKARVANKIECGEIKGIWKSEAL